MESDPKVFIQLPLKFDAYGEITMGAKPGTYKVCDVKRGWKTLECLGVQPVALRVKRDGSFEILTSRDAGDAIDADAVLEPWKAKHAGTA